MDMDMEPLKLINPELLTLSAGQLKVLMPYLVLFGGTLLTILASCLRIVQPKWPVFLLTLATLGVAGFQSFELVGHESQFLFNGMMASDSFSHYFNVVFIVAAGVTALSSFRYLDREKLQHPEYFVLLLFSALGMMLMASSMDLIVLFIALELMSLAVYVLVAFRRADRKCNEAAMKYFILGSAASAVLLYGIALLYGSTASVEIRAISALVRSQPTIMASPIFALGALLVVVGFLFKVASVPFHMWMPDVYEGAPVPVTGFMTTGLKAAAFAAFFRVFITLGLGSGLSELLQRHFHDILWVSAVATMAVGNFVALTQTNLKRLLAYSSIAHTGYLLLSLVAGPHSDLGFAPGVMYITVYAVMNLGAFVILTILSAQDDAGLNLHDLTGLAQRHPWLSFAMAVFLFSMAGIPPTAGFAAKYLLFYSAVQAGEIPLVLIGVLCSAVSVYYYLRVIVYMYMRDPVGSPRMMRVSIWSGFAVTAMVILTLQIGITPERMVNLAKRAVSSL